jgi:hypothetical protein
VAKVDVVQILAGPVSHAHLEAKARWVLHARMRFGFYRRQFAAQINRRVCLVVPTAVNGVPEYSADKLAATARSNVVTVATCNAVRSSRRCCPGSRLSRMSLRTFAASARAASIETSGYAPSDSDESRPAKHEQEKAGAVKERFAA